MSAKTLPATHGAGERTIEARSRRVPLGQKLGYAAGGLVDGTALHPLNVFLLFYVTSVCGLPGGLAGLAIAAGLVVDAVVDPLIGSFSDRHGSRLGRRFPFMLASLPLVAATFVLIFSLPAGWGQTALFLWLTTLSVCLRMSVSLFLLPHQALGAELTDGYSERSTIMALRWAMFMIGGIAGVFLGFGLFFSGLAGLSQRAQYTPFAVTLAAIIVVGGLIASGTALRTRAREHRPAEATGSALHVFSDLAEVFRNPSFRLLFAGTVLFFIGFGVNSVLGLHANTFFWRLAPTQTQAVTTALFFGLLLGAPLGGPLLARMEKRTVLLIGITGLLLAQALPVTLRLLGLFPFAGGTLATVLSLFALLTGVMMGCAGIAGASAMADAADEHEYLFGTRREGLYYAGLAFANKAAAGAGTLIAGLVLQAIAFPTDLVKEGGTSVHLPERMVDLLGLAYGPGAALLSIAAVLTYRSYRIDRRSHAAIIATLTDRRRDAADAAPQIVGIT